MSNKITKFPISFSQRRKNTLGPLSVECQVSGRCLRFHDQSSILESGEFIAVDVLSMQIEDEKKPHKICELIITREDLLEALKHILPKKD